MNSLHYPGMSLRNEFGRSKKLTTVIRIYDGRGHVYNKEFHEVYWYTVSIPTHRYFDEILGLDNYSNLPDNRGLM